MMKKETRMRDLSWKEWGLVGVICIMIFILVYAPHFYYKWPLNIDEWHHITEAIRLKEGSYNLGLSTVEYGFHVFLVGLSFFINLVEDYQYLAALWAVITGLVLFWVVFKKTGEFEVSLFAMVFFGSIRTDILILGSWFFTPLTLAIPFIFLYVYFFTEGIEKENKKDLLVSLGIMMILVFTHATSLSFAVPFLVLYCLIEWRKSLRMWKILLLFIIIPVTGILFFKYITGLSFNGSILRIIEIMKFRYGYGYNEYKSFIFDSYSIVGYLLALIGAGVLLFRKNVSAYLAYLFWPICVFVLIIVFRMIWISPISPYQRNIYYFVISMPLLSAIGLNYVLESIYNYFKKKNIKKEVKEVTISILILMVLILIFISYFNILGFWTTKENTGVTANFLMVDGESSSALYFLQKLDDGNVMAPLFIANAVYPVSGKDPVATWYFYGDGTKVNKFYETNDCNQKNKILQENNAKYILTKSNSTNCGWNKIYEDENYAIYKT